MEEKVTFELGSFFANAGIVALYRMLENIPNSENHYSLQNDILVVDKNFLLNTDLTQLFIDTAIQLETDNESGKFPKLLKEIQFLLAELKKNPDLNHENEKKRKSIFDSLESKSYKNAVVIDNKENIVEKLYIIIKNAKKEKDVNLLISLLETIYQQLNEEPIFKNLYFREIAYHRINKFWSGISFLNQNSAKLELKSVHYETFEKPFKEYLKNEEKRNLVCEECGSKISSKEYYNYSFLKGTTADTVRKKNDFWNYKINSGVCPKCRFLYSLIPLGFSRYNQNYLFLNSNTSVERLKDLNKENYATYKILDENKKLYYNDILLEYIDKQDVIRNDIEVIVADDEAKKFKVNVINKDILLFMKENIDLLKKLAGCSNVKLTENNTIYIFSQTFDNLIHLRNNYPLLNLLLKENMNRTDHSLFYAANYIFKIQSHLNEKRREKLNDEY